MHQTHLRNNKPVFKWDIANRNADISSLNLADRQLTCALLEPYAQLDMYDYAHLNEATYKDIASLIDPNFLNQRVRADELSGLTMRGFDNNLMKFVINSSKHSSNRIRYSCGVMFDQWDEIGQDPDLNFTERARMLLWVGDVRLHCTCPSFLYWGYQYILSVLDASIYPEPRKPNTRNPGDKGSVCKHLNRVMRVLPFYSADIASEMKKRFG